MPKKTLMAHTKMKGIERKGKRTSQMIMGNGSLLIWVLVVYAVLYSSHIHLHNHILCLYIHDKCCLISSNSILEFISGAFQFLSYFISIFTRIHSPIILTLWNVINFERNTVFRENNVRVALLKFAHWISIEWNLNQVKINIVSVKFKLIATAVDKIWKMLPHIIDFD